MSPGQVHILERVEQSTLSVIGIGGLVQYIRHSLTAMGAGLTLWSLVIENSLPLNHPPGRLYLLPPLHESIRELRKFDGRYGILLLTPNPVGDLMRSEFCRQVLFFTAKIQLR